MEEYDDAIDKQYPRGRGYGNDYMRGGEIFGGYGYRDRADYIRPRGELEDQRSDRHESSHGERAYQDPDPDIPGSLGPLEAEEQDEDDPAERFPQDARAGGWPVPHDFDDSGAGTKDTAYAPPATSPRPPDGTPQGHTTTEASAAPDHENKLAFGDPGGNISRSRSYYVTQAQLQWRLHEQGSREADKEQSKG